MSTNTIIDDLNTLPSEVLLLFEKREHAREVKDFLQSDKLREEIKNLGYLVNDESNGTKVLKIGDESLKPLKHFLILFGSGEIAPSSVDIYRQTFLQLGKRNLKISLITTPAGFQPNVELVYDEIKDFLLASLPDFKLTVNLIMANRLEDANDPSIVADLDGSDIILMGPGSPTYAVKHLKNSLLLAKIIELIKAGSSLILASAATISCSKYALPVYEIFKVGEELHWQDGLNLYQEIYQELTVIPHFNNREGGEGLDTSNCYIGANRASKLYAQLPLEAPLLGIDEHTALIIDLDSGKQLVRGKGNIHKLELTHEK